MAPLVTTTTRSPPGAKRGHLGAQLLDGCGHDGALARRSTTRCRSWPPSDDRSSPIRSSRSASRSSIRVWYSNSKPPMRTTSPARAPARARARSTPRPPQPALGVGQRLGVGQVRQGHGPLRRPARARPSPVGESRSTATPAGSGRCTTNRVGAGSSARASADQVAMRPEQRPQPLAGQAESRSPAHSTSGRRPASALDPTTSRGRVTSSGLVAAQLLEQDPLLLGGRPPVDRRPGRAGSTQGPGPLDVAEEPVTRGRGPRSPLRSGPGCRPPRTRARRSGPHPGEAPGW